MSKKNVISSLLFGVSSIAMLTGCVAHKDPILVEQEKCGNLKPVYSLEQNLKRISSEEGFSARVQNYTNFNPSIYAKSFNDIRSELQHTNLDFEIHNYADIMEVKKISIFSKGNRYSIDKEILKIEFIPENQKYYSVEQIVKIFEKHNYVLNVPKHLYSKPIILTPGASYKLTDLVNEVSNKLIEMSIPNTIHTEYNPSVRKNEIIVKLESLKYKFPLEALDELQKELRVNNIPSKIENGEIVILGNYKQQLFSSDLIEKKTKNLANVYIVCLKKGSESYDAIATNDGVETPLDTYDSITISKVGTDSNGIEDYSVIHKTKGNQKEYKIKTNDRKINISKENINAKIYLY